MPPLRLPYPNLAKGSAAQLWYERMQQGAVHKSKAMYMSVLPDNFQPSADMLESTPAPTATSNSKQGNDDDDMPPQWIMARGRGTLTLSALSFDLCVTRNLAERSASLYSYIVKDFTSSLQYIKEDHGYWL